MSIYELHETFLQAGHSLWSLFAARPSEWWQLASVNFPHPQGISETRRYPHIQGGFQTHHWTTTSKQNPSRKICSTRNSFFIFGDSRIALFCDFLEGNLFQTWICFCLVILTDSIMGFITIFYHRLGEYFWVTFFHSHPNLRKFKDSRLAYLPTFTINLSHSWIGKYASPMDPSWVMIISSKTWEKSRWNFWDVFVGWFWRTCWNRESPH